VAEQQQDGKEQPKGMRPNPTAKMLRWARMVAERLGLTLTSEQEENFEACKAFLDEHQDDTPPSEAQINYAKRIAEQSGIELPADTLTDYRKTSAWLAEHASRD